MSLNDDVDGWIAQLMQCKPLSEAEVKKLCDKVCPGFVFSLICGICAVLEEAEIGGRVKAGRVGSLCVDQSWR